MTHRRIRIVSFFTKSTESGVSSNRLGDDLWEIALMSTLSIRLAFLGLLLTGAVACSSSGGSLDTDKAKSQPAANAETNAATTTGEASLAAEAVAEPEQQQAYKKITQNRGTVANRGGYIRILVNKQPVTNYDIQRRVKFLQLRRVPGNRAKLAEEELIEQVMKLQEAKRRNVLASEAQVNEAFANFASRNRVSPARMSQELARLGVGAEHFKEFIRGQISWQRAVQGRFQAETTQVTERDAVMQLRQAGSAKPEVTEYNIQQVVFVIPKDKRNNTRLAARRAEATALRQRFTSCDETLNLAKTLRDVSVIDRKRIMEPELPSRWSGDIIEAGNNGVTRVRDTERGVEFIAVCSKRAVNDDRAAQISTQSAEFESFNQRGSEFSQKYLDEIRSRSTIAYF